MSNTLYDEAIADAKKLREVAEKNAKQAIIEAVTPKIRKFIEDQLINDEGSTDQDFKQNKLLDDISESVEISDEDVVLSESALGTLMGLIDSDDRLHNGQKERFQNALNESAQNLNNDSREMLLGITKKLKAGMGTLPSDGIVIGQELNSINIKENSEMPRSNETLYEVDLNDLSNSLLESVSEEKRMDKEEMALRELMRSMREDEDAEEAEEADDPMMQEIYRLLEQDAADDAAEAPADDAAGEALPLEDEGPDLPPEIDDAIAALEDAIADAVGGGAAPAEDLGAAPAEDLGAPGVEDLAETVEVDLNMLRSEIRKMRRLSEAGHEAHHMEGEHDKEEAHHMSDAHHMEGEHDKEEAHHMAETEDEAYSMDEGDKDEKEVKEENRKLRRAILNQGRNSRAMSSKLDEYRSAVQSLREQLTEMNLFNAKLLYVNKMLQNGDVSSSQRRSIIEALDSARSLREVKLLYKSLAESIGNRKNGRTLNESAVRRNLGSASRATTQASATSNEAAEVGRWAVLAGINK